MPARTTLLVIAPVLATLAAAPAVAADKKHSGLIVTVEPGRLVLEELTAARGSEPVPVRRTIVLERETTIALAVRDDRGGEGGWRGGFRPTPLGLDDVKPGDFATVTVEPADGRLLAREVTVVRPRPAP